MLMRGRVFTCGGRGGADDCWKDRVIAQFKRRIRGYGGQQISVDVQHGSTAASGQEEAASGRGKDDLPFIDSIFEGREGGALEGFGKGGGQVN